MRSGKRKQWNFQALQILPSDLLEQKATANERLRGLDLADYLIRCNFNEFTIEAKQELFSLTTTDIEFPRGSCPLTIEYKEIIIAGWVTRSGKHLDMLFAKDGEPVGIDELQAEVKRSSVHAVSPLLGLVRGKGHGVAAEFYLTLRIARGNLVVAIISFL